MSEPAPGPLSPLVLEEIRKRFVKGTAERVAEELAAASIPLSPPPSRGRDRIHLGVLILAGGDWRRFQDALRLAQVDWRDVLVGAGLENEDWPEVLARKGYRVP